MFCGLPYLCPLPPPPSPQVHDINYVVGSNAWNAASFGSGLLSYVIAALQQARDGHPVPGTIHDPSTKLLYVSGHDSHILYLQRLLGLSWMAANWPIFTTPPGSVLGIELWQNRTTGRHAVNLYFEVQMATAMAGNTPLVRGGRGEGRGGEGCAASVGDPPSPSCLPSCGHSSLPPFFRSLKTHASPPPPPAPPSTTRRRRRSSPPPSQTAASPPGRTRIAVPGCTLVPCDLEQFLVIAAKALRPECAPMPFQPLLSSLRVGPGQWSTTANVAAFVALAFGWTAAVAFAAALGVVVVRHEKEKEKRKRPQSAGFAELT